MTKAKTKTKAVVKAKPAPAPTARGRNMLFGGTYSRGGLGTFFAASLLAVNGAWVVLKPLEEKAKALNFPAGYVTHRLARLNRLMTGKRYSEGPNFPFLGHVETSPDGTKARAVADKGSIPPAFVTEAKAVLAA